MINMRKKTKNKEFTWSGVSEGSSLLAWKARKWLKRCVRSAGCWLPSISTGSRPSSPYRSLMEEKGRRVALRETERERQRKKNREIFLGEHRPAQ